MGDRRGDPNKPLDWDEQKREFQEKQNAAQIKEKAGFKSGLVIDISESDFMRIWNAASIRVMTDNNLLEELDLGYLRPEAMGSEEFYNRFCINTKEE
jgi:hypothetical protein